MIFRQNFILRPCCRLLRRVDLLGWILRSKWSWSLALAIGLVFVVWSYSLGVASFSASVVFNDVSCRVPPVTRVLLFGYVDHWHYGPWYLAGVPLFLGMAFAVCKRTVDQARLPDRSIPDLSRHPLLIFVGSVLLGLTVAKNIYAEYSAGQNDRGRLHFGWVQAPEIREMAARLHSVGSLTVQFERGYAIRDGEDRYLLAKTVSVLEVQPPTLPKQRDQEFTVFVILVKMWTGIWEAVVAYLSLLSLMWSLSILRLLKTRHGELGSILWAQKALGGLFVLGVFTNIYMILRTRFNRDKGTAFTSGDYWSLLVATPGVVAFAVFIVAVYLWYLEDRAPASNDAKEWWEKLFVGGSWLVTFGVLVESLASVCWPNQYDLISRCLSGQHVESPSKPAQADASGNCISKP